MLTNESAIAWSAALPLESALAQILLEIGMFRKHYPSGKAPTSTRRQILKALGSSAVLATVGRLAARSARANTPVPAEPPTKPSAITPTVQPFPLADVRLLDGPFLEAQKRDEAYLLKLEADRMLHNFRVNAG
ncbi:MAG TPA: hypothetical protein VGN88_02240, partial [Phycisphaerae bacterium]